MVVVLRVPGMSGFLWTLCLTVLVIDEYFQVIVLLVGNYEFRVDS